MFLIIKFIFLILSSSLLSAAELKSFHPQGVVKNVRQVRAVFSSEMIALGDLKDNIQPFLIDCPIKGQSRWADQKNWIYDFEQDLPAGVDCVFNLKNKLTDFKKNSVTSKTKKYLISTGGPQIFSSMPYNGSEHISEDQVFILVLDGKIKSESLEQFVYFKVSGLEEKLKAQILGGKLAEELIKKSYFYGEAAHKNKIAIKSARTFPSNTQISLIWDKGIETISGVKLEQPQIYKFKTRPSLTLHLNCERKNINSPCSPFSNLDLNFSYKIPDKFKNEIVVKNSKDQEVKMDLHSYAGEFQLLSIKGPHQPHEVYTISLRSNNSNILDIDGRELSNATSFPLHVKIDDYPPLLKFSAPFGIIESKIGGLLPVYIRSVENNVNAKKLALANTVGKNLQFKDAEEIIRWMKKMYMPQEMDSFLIGDNLGEDIKIPKVLGEKDFEVVGIPLKENGFYILEFSSQHINKNYNKNIFVKTSVLVTDLSVHLKWGHDNTLVWVTRLSDNSIVENANVTIYDSAGLLLAEGLTNKDGVFIISKKLLQNNPDDEYGSHSYQSGMFAFATKDGDLSFVHSSWNEGIEPFRFGYREHQAFGNHIGTSVLDRTLFRAGETVHIKNILRNHSIKGLSYPNEDFFKTNKELVIKYESWSESSFETVIPLNWDSFGHSEVDWKIPEDAKLGNYQIILRNKDSDNQWQKDQYLSRFRVEEFKVPLSKAYLKSSEPLFVKPKDISLLFGVEFLSGGGAAELPVKLRTKLEIGNGSGFRKDKTEKMREFNWNRGPYNSKNSQVKATEISEFDLKLDSTGHGEIRVKPHPSWKVPYLIHSEFEYKDPSGEVKSFSRVFPIVPSKTMIGVKSKNWFKKDEQITVETMVADIDGVVQKNKKVNIKFIKKQILSHRTKLAGGFYGFQHEEKNETLKISCEGKTDQHGIFRCTLKDSVDGEIIVEAKTVDDDNLELSTYSSFWVSGGENNWFETSNTDRMDILPEKKEYQPGETAKFQVQTPFTHGRILTTVEREGILDYSVQDFKSSNPIVNVPIKENFSPNVFITMFAIRGRISEPPATALLDLGRPSYKFGFYELPVGWKDKRLMIEVKTNKDIYKPREIIEATIKVKAENGGALSNDSEVIVAAVDEGLLQLQYNDTWNILPVMMGQRSNQVNSATAQMKVIGKRHYGKKQLPVGGGGGEIDGSRSLFDTLLTWKTKVKLDKNGVAKVSFPANDSITSYKLAVIAVAGPNQFGFGETQFKTNKDISIFSGVPAIARNGDVLKAEFTARNTTNLPIKAKFKIQVEQISLIQEKKITLKPNTSELINFEVKVPQEIFELSYQVSVVSENEKEIFDQAKIIQKIIPPYSEKVLQSTMVQLQSDKNLIIDLQKPKDSIANTGVIELFVSPTMIGGNSEVINYMKNYPYNCVEQKISRSIVLNDKKYWDEILSGMPSFIDAKGFFKYFQESQCGSDVLTAYILRVAQLKNWKIPADVQEKGLNALASLTTGGDVCGYIPNTHQAINTRNLNAIEVLSRYGRANAKMINSIVFEPNLWSNLNLIHYFNILKKSSVDNKNIPQLENVLKSRINFQSTVMTFSDTLATDNYLFMASEDYNLGLLINSLIDFNLWTDDIPKITRGLLSRKKGGKWDLTTANAINTIALEKFKEKFETTNTEGQIQVNFLKENQKSDFKNKNKEFKFKWGKETTGKIDVLYKGEGQPWGVINSKAALDLKEPLNSGYKIVKTIKSKRQNKSDLWSVGDIVQIELNIQAQSDLNWVVVNDPIPAGAVILNDRQNESFEGFFPAYVERSFDGFKAYYEFVKKGDFKIIYTYRYNTQGEFLLPPTRVEAMYYPEAFSEIPNRKVSVQ